MTGLLVLLLATACGYAPEHPGVFPRGPVLFVDVATPRMSALPLYLGVRAGPISIVPRQVSSTEALSDLRSGRAFAAVVSPLDVAASPTGLVVLERLASSSPFLLLSHRSAFFHWQDISGRAIVVAGTGEADFEAAAASYREAIRVPPVLIRGGEKEFTSLPDGFLVAPSPFANGLIASRKAALAVSLGAETGPWPSAVLVMSTGASMRWPRLTAFVVRSLWQNAVAENEASLPSLAARLAPAFAGTPPAVLRDALALMRHVGVLPTDPRVDPPQGSRLAIVFPGVDWQPFLSDLDQKDAERALRVVF